MRRTELDLCRIFGCLAVLMIHAGADIYHETPLQSASFAALNFISTAVRGGVPLFFMLSGALFLSRPTLNIRRLLLRHALRLTGLYYLWSLLYALLRLAGGSLDPGPDFFYAVVAGHYHLWFLPAMVLCYLFFPPVHAALHSGGLDGRYLLGLFFGLGLLMVNLNLTPDPAPLLFRFTQNFSLDYLPYLGYAVWGWWLAGQKLPEKTRWLAPLAYLAVTLLAALGNRWYSGYKGEADGWLFHYFSVPSFLQASAAFCFFLSLGGTQLRGARQLAALSDATLGVYLIHPMMLNVLERFGIRVTPAAPVASLLGVFLILTVLCFSLTLIARRIPGLRRIF